MPRLLGRIFQQPASPFMTSDGAVPLCTSDFLTLQVSSTHTTTEPGPDHTRRVAQTSDVGALHYASPPGGEAAPKLLEPEQADTPMVLHRRPHFRCVITPGR